MVDDVVVLAGAGSGPARGGGVSSSRVVAPADLQAGAAPGQAGHGWWTCPPWCRGNCTGGEVEYLGDGQTAVAGRLHERVLADVTCADYRQMRVRVIAERCDNPGATGVEQV